jgi:elongation factor P--beta-lysine ligase
MMSKKRRIRALPPEASDQEIARFFDEHDPQELERAGLVAVEEDNADLEELLQNYLREPNDAQRSIHLPRSAKEVLKRLARRKTLEASTLARLWIIERLRQEIKADT